MKTRERRVSAVVAHIRFLPERKANVHTKSFKETCLNHRGARSAKIWVLTSNRARQFTSTFPGLNCGNLFATALPSLLAGT